MATPSQEHSVGRNVGRGRTRFCGNVGGGFTGTPNVGFGLSDTAREVRLGWRLTPAGPAGPGFEVSLDATRSESAGGDTEPEHGIMLRGAMRW